MTMEVIARPRQSVETTILKRRILEDSPVAHTIIVCTGAPLIPEWETWVQANHPQPASVQVITPDKDMYDTICHQCTLHTQDISVYIDNLECINQHLIWSLWSTFAFKCTRVVATTTGELTQ